MYYYMTLSVMVIVMVALGDESHFEDVMGPPFYF